MKYFIFYMTLALSLMSCKGLQGKGYNTNAIVKVEIVSLRFDVRTRAIWSFEQLWSSRSDNVVRETVEDNVFFDTLDRHLQHLQKVTTGKYSVHHCIACKIFREDGKVDRLGISGLYTILNNKYYQVDDRLYLLIADKLPEDHKQKIYEFVRRKEERELQKQNGTYKEELEDWEKETDNQKEE